MGKQDLERIEHSVVAFYGIEANARTIQECYESCLRWFERCGCRPSRLGLGTTGKLVGFARTDKRLRSEGFDKVKSLYICSIPDDVEHQLQGCNSEFHLSPRGAYCYFNIRSAILALGSDGMLTIAKELIEMLRPKYGIGYRRPFGRGPGYYAMSLAHGDTTEEEDLRTSHWAEAQQRALYNQGQIRDMYPWNFLNRSQLDARVRKQTLAEWIETQPSRGRLQPISKELTLWTVEDKHIPEIFKVLFDAGIVFDYERDVVARMELGPPISGEEALGTVLNAMGYTPEEAEVLKVEGPAQVRELSQDEVRQAQKRGKTRRGEK